MSALSPAHRRRFSLGIVSGNAVLLACAALYLAVIGIFAFSGEAFAPHDPLEQDLGGRLLRPGASGSNGIHWFGTDALGRDILSLLIVGAAPALFVSLASVFLAASVGVAAGMTAGFRGGRAADALLLVTNIQLSFPFFLLAVTVVGILRPSIPLVIVVIGLGVWVRFARVTFSDTMQLRDLEYIEAVRVMRGSNLRILLRHIFPNIVPNIVVLATFALATSIIMESGLSFVGLGIPTEAPTWGRMLSEGRDYMHSAWWLTIFPGMAIFLLVLSVNIVGEQLRDYVDPKLSSRL